MHDPVSSHKLDAKFRGRKHPSSGPPGPSWRGIRECGARREVPRHFPEASSGLITGRYLQWSYFSSSLALPFSSAMA